MKMNAINVLGLVFSIISFGAIGDCNIDPYNAIEAENYNAMNMMVQGFCSDNTVAYVANQDSTGEAKLLYTGLEFGANGANGLTLVLASGIPATQSGTITVGASTTSSFTTIATFTIRGTGTDGCEFVTLTQFFPVTIPVTGTQNLLFTFTGISTDSFVNIDSFYFTPVLP